MAIKNKRGWLRIFEAFLGIMIIAGIILFIYSKQEVKSISYEYLTQIQSKILNDIGINKSLRIAVLKGDHKIINNFVLQNIPVSFGFEIKICELNDEVACKKSPPYVNNVYIKESIIASNLTLYSPKKVRLFLWQK